MSNDCTCNELLASLFQYLDSELDAAECERLKGHVDHCPHCTEVQEAERHMRDLIRRCCSERAPDELKMRVLGQITFMRQSITMYRASES